MTQCVVTYKLLSALWTSQVSLCISKKCLDTLRQNVRQNTSPTLAVGAAGRRWTVPPDGVRAQSANDYGRDRFLMLSEHQCGQVHCDQSKTKTEDSAEVLSEHASSGQEEHCAKGVEMCWLPDRPELRESPWTARKLRKVLRDGVPLPDRPKGSASKDQDGSQGRGTSLSRID